MINFLITILGLSTIIQDIIGNSITKDEKEPLFLTFENSKEQIVNGSKIIHIELKTMSSLGPGEVLPSPDR